MRVRITFYGMVLIELSEKDQVARVLAISATTMHKPYHHPILCAKSGTVVMDPPLPIIPSLDGLLDRTSRALRNGGDGWHLSGMTMEVGSGQLPTHQRRFSSEEPRHPKSVNASWNALKWIPDLGVIQPGATLKDEYRKISKNVLAIVSLRGGELKCLKPTNPQTAGLMWWFSPSCQQAATDLFTWEGDVADGVRLTDQFNTSRIAKLRQSKGTTELFFSHEAPRLEKDLQLEHVVRERGEDMLASPRLDHFPAFYAALDKCPYAVDAPRAVWRFDTKAESRYQSSIDCVPGLI